MKITNMFLICVACFFTLAACSINEKTNVRSAQNAPAPKSSSAMVTNTEKTAVVTDPVRSTTITAEKDVTEDVSIDPPEAVEQLEAPQFPSVFKSELEVFLDERLDTFYLVFGGSIGIEIRDANSNEVFFKLNNASCLIPASMTKIVLSSAYLYWIKDPVNSHYGEHEVTPESLSNLFRSLNRYSFETAYRANQTAKKIGNMLIDRQVYKTSGVTINEVLMSHLDRISWLEPCNYFDNAAGLSVNNRLTPYQVADSLYFLYGFPVYMDSLMQPGEGTLKDRLVSLQGIGRFKTGSLKRTGVISLAGFLPAEDTVISFVFILNDIYPDDHELAVQWLDDTIVGIYGIMYDSGQRPWPAL